MGLRSERLKVLKRRISSGWFIYRQNKAGLLGLCIVGFFIFIAIFAPYMAPYNPYKRVDKYFLPPSSAHILGTNDLGQDIFSELIYGARVSLLVGFLASISVVSVGTMIGLIAGYYGGIIDEILMRLCDIILVLPGIPLMILLAALLGRNQFHVLILAITLTSWPGVSRLIRSVTLSLKNRPFVEAARAIGAGDTYIMLKHILPNTLPLILSSAIYQTAGAMMSEASLSFLGLGDPSQKSWGMMLHYAQTAGGWWANMGYPAWWWIIPPGLCIALVVLGLMLIGQALEEVINPRLRRR
ncbi:MAG: ABC transporter permease [archaeon GB-1867-035]|nr:ABC transporter permease [Candidatus Culexmicrobium profundum]